MKFLPLSLILTLIFAQMASANTRVIDLTRMPFAEDSFFQIEQADEIQLIVPLTTDLPFFNIQGAEGSERTDCELQGLEVLPEGVSAEMSFQGRGCVVEVTPSDRAAYRVHLQR